MTSSTLNEMLNAQIFFKCENFQKVGAFKFRGALNAILQLSDEQKNKGVITHSSGNHAQAVALASRILGIKATIIMPKNSPKCKVEATRDTYKAEVVFCDNSVQSRVDTCNAIMKKQGQILIHPYNDDKIIAGAGTAALEFFKEIDSMDTVIVPVGGGGLLSGTSIASKGLNPNISVFAGEPEMADDAYRSFISGKVETNENPSTIADGLRTHLSELTLKIIRQNVDQIYLVSEEQIIYAMQFIWERMKIIVEPSSAVPLAAIFSGQVPVEGKKTGIIISGGNIDLNEFFHILYKNISS
jgi:threonine dehydratase